MNKVIRIVFTKRGYNIGSWLIRYGLPLSRMHLARSSHCLIIDGDYAIEATMAHGVRRVPTIVALKGQTIVNVVEYEVPDAEAGLKWAREQVGSKYDFSGAFGLLLAPGREWADESDWFCYELAAAALKHAGREIFRKEGHITGTMLLAIKPWYEKRNQNGNGSN